MVPQRQHMRAPPLELALEPDRPLLVVEPRPPAFVVAAAAAVLLEVELPTVAPLGRDVLPLPPPAAAVAPRREADDADEPAPVERRP